MRKRLVPLLADIRLEDLEHIDEADLTPDVIRERLRRCIRTSLNGEGDDLIAELDKAGIST